jgi:ATP synthase protein I
MPAIYSEAVLKISEVSERTDPQPNVVRVTNRWQDEPEEEFNSLSAEQARQWRLRQASSPIWRSLAWQIGMGLPAAAGIGLVWQSETLAWSAAYGMFAVVLPQMLLLRGMAGVEGRWSPGALLFRFFVWEMVKIALTVAILFSAVRVLGEMSWPALMAGLVVTMKANWLVLALRTANRSPDGKG